MGAGEQADRGQKSKRRKDEEEEVEERAELPRMIGALPDQYRLDKDWQRLTDAFGHEAHLTATENEDWALILEVCERASASEANAKEAIKALRWEFKWGT
jgi:hypothetical protein